MSKKPENILVNPHSEVGYARGNTGTSWLQGNDETLPLLENPEAPEDSMGRPSIDPERSTRDEVVISKGLMANSSLKVEFSTRPRRVRRTYWRDV